MLFDSYYMLMPITIKKEDWKHKEKVKLSIEKAKEIQEFLMGRLTKIFTKKDKEDKEVYDSELGSNVLVKDGKRLLCNSLNKRIIGSYAIIEIDFELMAEYEVELRESCIDNNVDLLTHAEILQYIADEETI